MAGGNSFITVAPNKTIINEIRPYLGKTNIFLLTVPIAAAEFIEMHNKNNLPMDPSTLMKMTQDVEQAMGELAFRN